MAALLNTVSGLGDSLLSKGQGLLDNIFPPEKRAELWAKIQGFVMNHPKLSAFLVTNIALTGAPLFLFVLFSLTVFVFSLIAALVIGLLVAVLFTVAMVGVALLILFPTVFFTTLAASFLFLWGVGGYYILKWFNKGQTPADPGSAIGDKLNSLTGGKLDFFMDNARKQETYKQAEKSVHPQTEKPQTNGQTNGTHTPKKINKQDGGGKTTMNKATDAAKNIDHEKVTNNAVTNNAKAGAGAGAKQVQGATDGVTKKAGNVTGNVSTTAGTAKGLVGGATGLT